MKKIKQILLLTLFMMVSVVGLSQTRGNLFTVLHNTDLFGYTLPATTIVYCVDSNKFYQLTQAASKTMSLSTTTHITVDGGSTGSASPFDTITVNGLAVFNDTLKVSNIKGVGASDSALIQMTSNGMTFYTNNASILSETPKFELYATSQDIGDGGISMSFKEKMNVTSSGFVRYSFLMGSGQTGMETAGNNTLTNIFLDSAKITSTTTGVLNTTTVNQSADEYYVESVNPNGASALIDILPTPSLTIELQGVTNSVGRITIDTSKILNEVAGIVNSTTVTHDTSRYLMSVKEGTTNETEIDVRPYYHKTTVTGILKSAIISQDTSEVIITADTITLDGAVKLTQFTGVGAATDSILSIGSNQVVRKKPTITIEDYLATHSLTAGVLTKTVIDSTFIMVDSLKFYSTSSVIADDASILLPIGKSGYGSVHADSLGTIVAWVDFYYNSDGVTFLKLNSSRVVNTDTDNNVICVIDAGTGAAIKNRSGYSGMIYMIENKQRQ